MTAAAGSARQMTALTIQQPWAWAIAAGHKPVENRSWSPSYRGPLAIHAGKTVDRAALDHPLVQAAIRHWLGGKQLHGSVPDWERGVGAIIAVADLTGVCSPSRTRCCCNCGPWAGPDDAHHWHLANVQPLAEPIPCRGALGLWRPPPDIAERLTSAIGGAQ